MNNLLIKIYTNNGSSVDVELFPESSVDSLFVIDDITAKENGEAVNQIQEGYTYEYSLTEGFLLEEISGIVYRSKSKSNLGRIVPGVYVGTLVIGVFRSSDKEKVGELTLEVRSVKTSYRQDYRLMLEDITEKCAELLLQAQSPVSQYFTVNFNADAKTLYQRFAFIKTVLTSEEFSDAVHKFLVSPITTWTETEIEKDIRNVRRVTSRELRQIVAAGNRINLPDLHPLKSAQLTSIPQKIRANYKKETIDTPENRFVKHALYSFLVFCSDFRLKAKSYVRLSKEAAQLEDKIEQYLSHSVFKEISSLITIPGNSPVLQRKEGYREIFRTWLMFDLASKLIWQGGDDVYSGNKKDVAVLYEYWLFFKLLDLVKEVFHIEPASTEALIEQTSDELGLRLKQGKHIPINGVYESENRKLNVQFSYNRTFNGGSGYPVGGSWSRSLRPDYTLSIWPYGIGQREAEEEELITHIHFDAKYRVETLTAIFGESGSSEEEILKAEKEENTRGIYKRADLLKMHTYKDAIRRTAGAYVLYPGTESQKRIGFHEILPGLGAFAIRPSREHSGTVELKTFLYDIVNHFLNRTSQREKMALRTYEVFKGRDVNELKELLPEAIGSNRSFYPDDINVLVGYYKNEAHLHWILKNKLYNSRTGSTRGSLRLGQKEAGAQYLLLHTAGETKTSRLFKLNSGGPRLFSKQELINKNYPDTKPSQDAEQKFYLVYDIEGPPEKEFLGLQWDITKFQKYSTRRGSGLPFAVTLTELMQVVIG